MCARARVLRFLVRVEYLFLVTEPPDPVSRDPFTFRTFAHTITISICLFHRHPQGPEAHTCSCAPPAYAGGPHQGFPCSLLPGFLSNREPQTSLVLIESSDFSFDDKNTSYWLSENLS